jgi:hypothetical protein
MAAAVVVVVLVLVKEAVIIVPTAKEATVVRAAEAVVEAEAVAVENQTAQSFPWNTVVFAARKTSLDSFTVQTDRRKSFFITLK